MSASDETHWEHIYETRSPDEVSWYQEHPATSIRLIEQACSGRGPVVDVGGGASRLVDALVARDLDVTVIDVSQHALDTVERRLTGELARVNLVHVDVLHWRPGRVFDVWHDRAVFHFLTDPDDRQRYVRLAVSSLEPGGTLIIGTFASDGPTHCSGLPVCRYEAAELAVEFGEHVDLVHSEREVHVTPAGVGQPFTWAVLRRRVARRPR